jgi:hypothetical protein
VSRPVAAPSSACLFPDLFAARCCGESARQSSSRPNTIVHPPKIAKHRKISTYAKRVRNSCRISTSIFSVLKSLWNQHLQKNREGDLGFLAGRPHADQQPMTEIVKRQKGVLRAKVRAATVYQQDELRGVKRSHQELSRVNEVHAAFRWVEQPMIGIVERQKGVGITPLLPYNKER